MATVFGWLTAIGITTGDNGANVYNNSESAPTDSPRGTRPIDKWGIGREDIHDIKEGIGGLRGDDWVGVAPDGTVIVTGPGGRAVDVGHVDDYTKRPLRQFPRPWLGHVVERAQVKRQNTKLSLHIKHPTRDLSRVCAVLELEPTRIWKKGDERQTPKGTKIGGTRADSYCSIAFGAMSRKPLPKQIEAALSLLKPHREILRKLSSTGGLVSFYVGWFCDEHTGEHFDWQILDTMADLRIALDLNIYVPDVPPG
jgi:hypothetical protein